MSRGTVDSCRFRPPDSSIPRKYPAAPAVNAAKTWETISKVAIVICLNVFSLL